jgi:threonine dehydrogenase-like Zn-dependent dehydrogenase
MGCLSHTMEDFAAGLALLADHTVTARGLVTDVVPLGDIIAQGFRPLRYDPGSHLKIVAVPAKASLSPNRRAHGGNGAVG